MTDIVAPAGAKRPANGLLSAIGEKIGKAFHGYRHRQTLHELASLDDHLLEDIGVPRAELSVAALSEKQAMRDNLHLPRHLIG